MPVNPSKSLWFRVTEILTPVDLRCHRQSNAASFKSELTLVHTFGIWREAMIALGYTDDMADAYLRQTVKVTYWPDLLQVEVDRTGGSHGFRIAFEDQPSEDKDAS